MALTDNSAQHHGTPPGKVTPKRIATQLRRRDALLLRGQGHTYQRIADLLGYSSAGEARKQVQAAYAGVVNEPALELLALQLERLDSVLTVAWTVAHDPSASSAVRLRATNSAAEIIEKISQLTGLVPGPTPIPKRRMATEQQLANRPAR